MANIRKLLKFFELVDNVAIELSGNEHAKRKLLEEFFFRVLTIMDGLEGDSLEWSGIALVEPEDLTDEVAEINDEMLHDSWTSR